MKEKSKVHYYYPHNEPYSFCGATTNVLKRMGVLWCCYKLNGVSDQEIFWSNEEPVGIGKTWIHFGGSTQMPWLIKDLIHERSFMTQFSENNLKRICLCTEQETNSPYPHYAEAGKNAREAYSHFVYFNRADEHLYRGLKPMYSLPWVDEKDTCFRHEESTWRDRYKRVLFIGKLDHSECYQKRYDLWDALINDDLISQGKCPYSDTEFTALRYYNEFAATIDLPGSGSGPSIRAFEAAACGMALILKEGESREIFGDAAYYYDPEDYKGLKKLIETMDWSEAEVKAQKAWELMQGEYSSERTIQKILDWSEE